ncbi:hypothetical protein DS67_02995 [Mesotoga sp. SC_4PWA21]|nr:hypothetical protein DS67_02995 [Mesotoga sp. SC_4PWA21]
MVSKSGKVRVEERERDRGESSRLLVSAANVSTVLFLDGLISERILVLGRLTEDRSSSVQRSAFFYKRVLRAISGSLFLSVQRNFRARSRAKALYRCISGQALRDDGSKGSDSRLLVSEANVSTLLFLDRMVLAVNGFMILNGQRRTMF